MEVGEEQGRSLWKAFMQREKKGWCFRQRAREGGTEILTGPEQAEKEV
jgi:hypothetical protein